jgi:hypothetical protein
MRFYGFPRRFDGAFFWRENETLGRFGVCMIKSLQTAKDSGRRGLPRGSPTADWQLSVPADALAG